MVPYAIMWTGEEGAEEVKWCPYANALAVHKASAMGVGDPLFAFYHPQRSRRCVFEELCEICGNPIDGPLVCLSACKDVYQGHLVTNEPLCCKACAIVSIAQCPSLKSQVDDSSLIVREVLRYDIFPQFNESGVVDHLLPGLKQWRTRGLEWLGA